MEINYKKIREKELDLLPFKHIVVDDLFEKDFLINVEKDFPELNSVSWWKYDNTFEKKLAFNRIEDLKSDYISRYFEIINSREFCKEIEEKFKIKNILADPSLRGGGLHRIQRGGKLDIHSDFPYHKVTGWRRKINVLTFLNLDWKESYGGFLEFWDKDMKNCQKKIKPSFNKTVFFLTDEDSYHGHPDPLNCPEEVSRKSLASYYYVLSEASHVGYTSTSYKRRPFENEDQEKEILREKRRQGRLEDIKT